MINMGKMIKERIELLRKTIRKCEKAYYVHNHPIVSDFEFDWMMKQLEELEKEFPQFDSPDSPTHKVGSDLKKTYKTK